MPVTRFTGIMSDQHLAASPPALPGVERLDRVACSRHLELWAGRSQDAGGGKAGREHPVEVVAARSETGTDLVRAIRRAAATGAAGAPLVLASAPDAVALAVPDGATLRQAAADGGLTAPDALDLVRGLLEVVRAGEKHAVVHGCISLDAIRRDRGGAWRLTRWERLTAGLPGDRADLAAVVRLTASLLVHLPLDGSPSRAALDQLVRQVGDGPDRIGSAVAASRFLTEPTVAASRAPAGPAVPDRPPLRTWLLGTAAAGVLTVGAVTGTAFLVTGGPAPVEERPAPVADGSAPQRDLAPHETRALVQRLADARTAHLQNPDAPDTANRAGSPAARADALLLEDLDGARLDGFATAVESATPLGSVPADPEPGRHATVLARLSDTAYTVIAPDGSRREVAASGPRTVTLTLVATGDGWRIDEVA